MIKKKKFLLASFEIEQGAKHGLFQTLVDGATDANASTPTVNTHTNKYDETAFKNFIEKKRDHTLTAAFLGGVPFNSASGVEGVTSYSARLATLSTAHLTDEQLAVVIGMQAQAEKEYDRSYKGMHFVDGGRIDIDNTEKALAENKKIFIAEQERRAELNKEITIEKTKERIETTELKTREHDKTTELEQREKIEAYYQKQAAQPLVDAQNEANALKKKEMGMEVLDVNEFKAFDVIVKYQLQDSEKFKEFTDRVHSHDPDAVNAFKTLQSSLHKKYGGQINTHNESDIQAGVQALISENSEAIEKYAKAQEKVHLLGAPNAGQGEVQKQEITK